MRDPETGAEHSTGLAELLEERGVRRVVVIGLALDYCVKDTALDAVTAGFEATLPQHATRAVNLQSGDDQRALEVLAGAGIELT